MLSLHNQVVLVVGASSGMGRATAARLAREGARVVACARREDRLQALQSELRSEGLEIEIAPLDATSRADVERVVEGVLATRQRIDALVYATGTNIPERSLEVLTPEDWEMM